MTVEELKNELALRLNYVNSKIESAKADLGDPVLHHHHKGFLEAADGMFGERQFLEKLIEKCK